MDDNYEEQRFLVRARELLDKALEDLDSRTTQRLEQNRMKAASGVDEWWERLVEDIQRRI